VLSSPDRSQGATMQGATMYLQLRLARIAGSSACSSRPDPGTRSLLRRLHRPKGSAMSATQVAHQSSAIREASHPTAVRTVLTWIGVSLLGFPLGGYLGYLVGGRVDAVVSALLGGALTGAGIGLAQWSVLRRWLRMGPGWIVATSAGLTIGLAIGASAVGYETTMSQLAIMGGISGAFVGVAQGVLLRNRSSRWYAWTIAMAPLWAVGWVVTTAGGILVEKQFTVFGAYGAATFGILSGLLLIAVMRRRAHAPA
jgi:hypothetical protein